ncbi:hypothetical protein CC86DRAFT_436425 [Ophiobolus disseminans]|uniref:SnoaL-like domain-containing protein n=1 Tax=Ophiobolus disseminans TaxID=1469910 RepID=A0A6A7AAF4_9PLEO|nr:hypothetical protein CC86DRAFT_436425 [Ophiobolus disseminans]
MPPKHAGDRHAAHIQRCDHADHDLIVERLEEYIKAYRTGKPDAMMQFYHPENFVYSDFTADRQGMGLKDVKETYKKTFTQFHDLEIKTMSVHGHKNFTAWEWEITCKPGIDYETGAKIAKEDATLKKLVGCTLMWWEEGKIVRNHDYVQTKDV